MCTWWKTAKRIFGRFTTGIVDGDRVAVIDGLQAGDRSSDKRAWIVCAMAAMSSLMVMRRWLRRRPAGGLEQRIQALARVGKAPNSSAGGQRPES